VLITVRAVTPGIAWTVECESPVGTITGHWQGEAVPEVGLREDVELDTAGA
jgi:hypothetical protein